MRSPRQIPAPPRAGCGMPDRSTDWSSRRNMLFRPSHPPDGFHAVASTVTSVGTLPAPATFVSLLPGPRLRLDLLLVEAGIDLVNQLIGHQLAGRDFLRNDFPLHKKIDVAVEIRHIALAPAGHATGRQVPMRHPRAQHLAVITDRGSLV